MCNVHIRAGYVYAYTDTGKLHSVTRTSPHQRWIRPIIGFETYMQSSIDKRHRSVQLGLCCCTKYRDVSGGTPAARAEDIDLSSTALIQSKLFVSKRSTVEHAGHAG